MAGAILKKAPRIIDARTHGIIDYVHAATNFVAGALFWKYNKAAAAGAWGLGTAILANAMLTDYPLGVFRLYSFRTHGMLDYGVAAASGFMPEMAGIRKTSVRAKFFRAEGAGETAIAALTDYDDTRGAKRFR